MLTEQQCDAIDLMLEGKHPVEVAKIIDVSRSTMNRWFRQPDFKDAWVMAQQSLVFFSLKKAAEHEGENLNQWVSILANRSLSWPTRFNAARKFLESMEIMIDHVERMEIWTPGAK